MTNHRAYYFEDVATHSSKGDCWVIISGKVYNVSTFLDDHPGGDEVLLAATGKDATVDFDDVGHSDEAKDLMRKYCIGEVDKSTLPLPVRHRDGSAATEFDAGKNHSSTGGLAKMLQLLIPLFILAAALALRQYKNRHHNDNK